MKPAMPPQHAARLTRAPWRWALGGALVGGMLALALVAPAWWLADGIAWASGGRLQLREPRGTVWNGSAQWVLTGGKNSHDEMALPGRIIWQLRPHLAGLALRWQADCCMAGPLAVRIAPHWGGASITLAAGSAHDSRWPASLLAGLGTPWNTMQPQGWLALRLQDVAITLTAGRVQMTGRAELDALALRSRLSTIAPLGSYRLRLQGGSSGDNDNHRSEGDLLTLQLTTLDGPLHLQGQGQWVGQRLRFRGEAWAAEDSEAALANLLTIIGQRRGTRTLLQLG